MEEVLHRFREIIEKSYKYSHNKITDLTEMKAYFGILYMRGALFIEFIDFDDGSTQEERWKFDNFVSL